MTYLYTMHSLPNKISAILLFLLTLLPLLSEAQQRQMLPLSLQNDLRTFAPDATVPLFLRGNPDALATYVRLHDGTLKKVWGDIISCALPAAAIAGLNSLPGLTYVEYSGAKPRVLSDIMLINNNVLPVHQGVAPLPEAYHGQDVIIGIIDTGIELAHPDFQHFDGSTRVLALWDQTQAEAVPYRVPQPYGYGQEWNAEDINAGLTGHDDQAAYYGHGSTVAGVAAGNGNATGNFTGVAPKADLIVVSSDLDSPNWPAITADAIDFIFAKAEAFGKPAVINLSLGDYYGSHDGLDAATLTSTALLDATPGRAIVAAAGNSGNLGNYHLSYDIPETDTAFTWFKYSPAAQAVFFEIWSDTADFQNTSFSIGADITAPAWAFHGYAGWRNAAANLDSVITDTLFYNNLMVGIVDTWCGLRGAQYQIQIQVRQPFSSQYYWRFATTGGGRFDCWSHGPFGTSAMVTTNLPAPGAYPDMAGYRFPDNKKTIVNGWACSEKVITVGNYVNRSSFVNYLHQETTYPETPGAIFASSSRGPDRRGLQKPDIAASGEHTLSAGRLATLNQFMNINPEKVAEDGMHYVNGGTSIASPVVAGVAALYLDRDPAATWLDVKNAIIDNALADFFTGMLPGDQFGYGKIDAFATLTNPFPLSRVSNAGRAQSIRLFPNPANERVRLLSASGALKMVWIADISGRIINAIPAELKHQDTITLDISDLPCGVYLVTAELLDGGVAITKLIVEK